MNINSELFSWLIIANPILLVLILATEGRLKKFFLKVWLAVFFLGVIIIILSVLSGIE